MSHQHTREFALTFVCGQENLVGILHAPAEPSDVGVVVIVGGPQYRPGSHRQFVLLARAMAERGFPALRFDYRGMGDSGGELRNFESVSEDVTQAIDALCKQQPSVRRVVLWGLCDGASAALLHTRAMRDSRVAGLCLVNPWARTEVGLARTHLRHYYLKRLLDRDFWASLFRGGITASTAADVLRNVRLAKGGLQGQQVLGGGTGFLAEMAQACRDFQGRILIVCSADDLTAKEFQQAVNDNRLWRAALQRSHVKWVEVPSADHTFSDLGVQALMTDAVVHWLGTSLLSPVVTPAPAGDGV